jgi:2-polyprenyl-3-methyl-5-hydroxy-6-metoxy-1,4-benzoquinol methylase
MLEKNEIPSRYDKIAERYVQEGNIPFYDMKDKIYIYIYEKNLKEIISLLGNLQNKKILDAGCGGGFYSIPLATLCDEIYALDISFKNLQILKRRAKAGKLSNINIIHGDIENFPLKSDFFDFILLLGVLEHLPNTQKAVKELQRILVSGGKIICILPNHEGIFWRINKIKAKFRSGSYRDNLQQPEYTLNSNFLMTIFIKNHLKIMDFFTLNFGMVLKCFDFIPKIEKLNALFKRIEYAFNRTAIKNIIGTDLVFILQKETVTSSPLNENHHREKVT